MAIGAAGALALPKWRIPDPTIILPSTDLVIRRYVYEARALAYTVTSEEVAENLYAPSLIQMRGAEFKRILMPGLLKIWQDHYNNPEYEDLFK